MKIAKNKLSQKILIVICAMLMLFNFAAPVVKAASINADKVGGTLFEPIQTFLVFLGDSIIWGMQYAFYGLSDFPVEKLSEGDEVPTDSFIDKLDKINKTVGSAQLESIKAALLGPAYSAKKVYTGIREFLGLDDVYIPEIIVSPESIFSNQIPAFDINFFSPGGSIKETVDTTLLTNYINQYTTSKASDKLYELATSANEYLETVKGLDDTLDSYIKEAKSNLNEDRNEVRYSKLATTYQNIINYYENNSNEYTVRGSSASILQSTVSYWYNLLKNIAIIGLLSVLVYIGIRIVISSTAADKSKYKEMIKDWVIAICLLFFMHYFMSFVVTVTASISTAIANNESGIGQHTTTIELEENAKEFDYFGDELIGNARLQLQSQNFGQQMAFTIIYLVLVIYTLIFALMYLKRVIYMAFLTMIAPLVALTYPLDKIRDGKAQAFDMWMKEYVFNALIQPFHLIIYYVIVGSSIALAKNNPLYAIVAIGFMLPAEKLLRRFFGFNKSETSGALGGMLGGALVMQGVNAFTKRIGHIGGKGKPEIANGNKPIKSYDRSNDAGRNKRNLLDLALGGDVSDAQNESEEGNLINTVDNNSNETTNTRRIIPTQNQNESEISSIDDKMRQIRENDDDYGHNFEYISLLNRKQQLEEEQAQIQNSQFEDYDEENPEDIEDTNPIRTQLPENTEQNTNSDEIDAATNAKLKAFVGARFLGKAAKFTGKGIVKAYGAATLGTIGAVAGLASEDYKNVASWGVAGAVGGSMAANAAMKKIPSTAYRIKADYENARSEAEEKILTKDQRKALNNKRADDAFMRDTKAQQKYIDAFGKQKYRARMQDAIEYRKYGITNDDAIIKAMKLKTLGEENYTDNLRKIVAGYADRYSNIKEINTFKDDLKEKKYGKNADLIADALREYHDI